MMLPRATTRSGIGTGTNKLMAARCRQIRACLDGVADQHANQDRP